MVPPPRVPTDTNRKQFYLTRAQFVSTLCSLFPDITQNEARDIEEKEIFAKGHDSLFVYHDVAIEYIRAKKEKRSPFEEPVCNDVHGESKVSEERLKKMFEVPAADLVSGKKVMVKCPKCKSVEVTVVAAQTRSADEGMTGMNKCERCGHLWKD